MHTIDATHAREGSLEPTRADEDGLSSSSEAPPSDIDANSVRNSSHLADADAAVPLAPQTLSAGFDEGASRESTSEGTQASANGLRSHSVGLPTHADNTTDPAQHAIAMSIAAQYAASSASAPASMSLSLSYRRATAGQATSPTVPGRLPRWITHPPMRLSGESALRRASAGDAADADASENEAIKHRKSTGDAEPHDPSATLEGDEEVVVPMRKGPRVRRRASTRRARAPSFLPVSVDEGRPVRQIVTAQAAVSGPPAKPK